MKKLAALIVMSMLLLTAACATETAGMYDWFEQNEEQTTLTIVLDGWDFDRITDESKLTRDGDTFTALPGAADGVSIVYTRGEDQAVVDVSIYDNDVSTGILCVANVLRTDRAGREWRLDADKTVFTVNYDRFAEPGCVWDCEIGDTDIIDVVTDMDFPDIDNGLTSGYDGSFFATNGYDPTLGITAGTTTLTITYGAEGSEPIVRDVYTLTVAGDGTLSVEFDG